MRRSAMSSYTSCTSSSRTDSSSSSKVEGPWMSCSNSSSVATACPWACRGLLRRLLLLLRRRRVDRAIVPRLQELVDALAAVDKARDGAGAPSERAAVEARARPRAEAEDEQRRAVAAGGHAVQRRADAVVGVARRRRHEAADARWAYRPQRSRRFVGAGGAPLALPPIVHLERRRLAGDEGEEPAVDVLLAALGALLSRCSAQSSCRTPPTDRRRGGSSGRAATACPPPGRLMGRGARAAPAAATGAPRGCACRRSRSSSRAAGCGASSSKRARRVARSARAACTG